MIKISEIFKSTKATYILILVSALIGFTASMALTYEKIELLKDPSHVPACSINPIITCNSAMSSVQSEFLGIPVSIIGLIAFTALITATVLLMNGVKFPKNIWLMIVTASTAALLAILYLIIVSIFFLHKVCPWCFTIWITTPLIFLGTTVGYVNNITNKKLSKIDKAISFVAKNANNISGIWYALFFLSLLVVFWDFWVSLVP
jgi:uncharacterized membrane protein